MPLLVTSQHHSTAVRSACAWQLQPVINHEDTKVRGQQALRDKSEPGCPTVSTCRAGAKWAWRDAASSGEAGPCCCPSTTACPGAGPGCPGPGLASNVGAAGPAAVAAAVAAAAVACGTAASASAPCRSFVGSKRRTSTAPSHTRGSQRTVGKTANTQTKQQSLPSNSGTTAVQRRCSTCTCCTAVRAAGCGRPPHWRLRHASSSYLRAARRCGGASVRPAGAVPGAPGAPPRGGCRQWRRPCLGPPEQIQRHTRQRRKIKRPSNSTRAAMRRSWVHCTALLYRWPALPGCSGAHTSTPRCMQPSATTHIPAATEVMRADPAPCLLRHRLAPKWQAPCHPSPHAFTLLCPRMPPLRIGPHTSPPSCTHLARVVRHDVLQQQRLPGRERGPPRGGGCQVVAL